MDNIDDDPFDEDTGQSTEPPAIFISLSKTNEDINNGEKEEDLKKLAAPSVPNKARPPSPSFIPGSLFRKFSHPRTPRASTQSIDSIEESLTDQTDIVE